MSRSGGGSAYLQRYLRARLHAAHAPDAQIVMLDGATTLSELAPIAKGEGRIVVEGTNAALPPAQLPAQCDRAGLHIGAVIPYAAIAPAIGGREWLAGSLAGGGSWERVLSWAEQDVRFRAFLAFIDAEVAGNLASVVSKRYLAILLDGPDAAANAEWLERDVVFAAALARGFTQANVAPFVGKRWEEWRRELRAHLDHPRNLVALVRLLDAARRASYPIAIGELLDGGDGEFVAVLLQRLSIDDASMRLIDDFESDPALRDLLAPHPGFSAGLKWELLPNVIGALIGLR